MVPFPNTQSVLTSALADESSQRQYIEEQAWLDLACGRLDFADPDLQHRIMDKMWAS